MEINQLLTKVRAMDCSDLHLSEGLPVTIRRYGALLAMGEQPDEGKKRELIRSLCSEEQIRQLERGEDVDFAYAFTDRDRYRVNVYHHRLGLAAAVRVLRGTIPTLEDLHLPPVLKELSDKPNGLILVTGPTGSGKSTTLAAMIDYITRTRTAHIITIEDPIEYVFEQNRSMVHQREVGATVMSFASAIRSALREDPDILLVGEMRDYETISTAVTAAETGHLVLSTLHTTGATQTIDRIVDTCPPQAQQQMRTQLSMILRGIITQTLLPVSTGDGRIAATEILLGTDAACNLIRENKCFQLPTVMQSGKTLGMHTMNTDLFNLLSKGKITEETAMAVSPDRKDLVQYLH
jgi:twitching motility protein PilT